MMVMKFCWCKGSKYTICVSLHALLCPWISDLLLFLLLKKGAKTIEVNKGVVNESDPFFLATFISSVLSAAFGVTNLLKLGPCPLVPRNKFGLVFVLAFLSVIGVLSAKGMMAFLMMIFTKSRYEQISSLAFLFCSSYLLPTLYVSV